MEYVELRYLATCTPDYFLGFGGHVYAVPLDEGDTYADVLDCLAELVEREEIDFFEDNYNKISNDVLAMRHVAKEKGYLHKVFSEYIGPDCDTYAYFGVVTRGGEE